MTKIYDEDEAFEDYAASASLGFCLKCRNLMEPKTMGENSTAVNALYFFLCNDCFEKYVREEEEENG